MKCLVYLWPKILNRKFVEHETWGSGHGHKRGGDDGRQQW